MSETNFGKRTIFAKQKTVHGGLAGGEMEANADKPQKGDAQG